MVFMKHVNDQTEMLKPHRTHLRLVDVHLAIYFLPDVPNCVYMRTHARVKGERESFINGDRGDNKQVYIYKGGLY